jgi:hypothetical protein
MESDPRIGGGRNHGSIVVRGEQGVIIAVVVFIDEGKLPIVGSSRVAPTLKDSGACLVVGLDVVLGEGDRAVCVAQCDNANQDSGEGWHDVPWRADGGRFLSLTA